jgi:hypothetical protein
MYNAPFGSSDASNLPDLTSMMFPSSDPFAYPNQPMTALEDAQVGSFGSDNLQDLSQAQQSGMLPTSPTGPPPGSAGFSDAGMDMQIFGMPPYLMQGQQPGLGMGLGLFQGENAGPGGMDDPWAGLAKQENVDWGSWGEGNFGG